MRETGWMDGKEKGKFLEADSVLPELFLMTSLFIPGNDREENTLYCCNPALLLWDRITSHHHHHHPATIASPSTTKA